MMLYFAMLEVLFAMLYHPLHGVPRASQDAQPDPRG